MDSARVAAAVRQIMDETAGRAPRAGRNVLMLAWFEDEMGALPRNPGDYDIISMTAPLGPLVGNTEYPDADRKVFLGIPGRRPKGVSRPVLHNRAIHAESHAHSGQ